VVPLTQLSSPITVATPPLSIVTLAPQISLDLRNQGRKVKTGSRGFIPNDVFNRSPHDKSDELGAWSG
jgi:hypothetical protein